MSFLFTSSDWTWDVLNKTFEEIEKIAHEELELTYYPVQLEIISSDQMLEAYSSVGLPMMYNHWSFGKSFISNHNKYTKGHMGLAYEVVSNTNPCIAYLMEENSMTMQALVMAHAGCGHNSFFANNYLFKTWTSADTILDYLQFAKNYIIECEERYGVEKVEEILDACHALMNHGVDKYRRPAALSIAKEKELKEQRQHDAQRQINELWSTLPSKNRLKLKMKDRYPKEPEENILYFIEKNSPNLEPWQREIVRIVRKISQYFYPQMQTQVANEGWATTVHYYIMQRLYDKGLINDGSMIEFLKSHTGVVFQPKYNETRRVKVGEKDGKPIYENVNIYNGINPYALGFDIFKDIKRMCERPTDEDREWFPDIAGSDWLKTWTYAYQNFRDESFIRQFLSPKVIRDWRLFQLRDEGGDTDHYKVHKIHDDRGYKEVRKAFADSYDLGHRLPHIVVWHVNMKGDRRLVLRYYQYNGVPLDDSHKAVLKHVWTLWGYDVVLESIHPETGALLSISEYKKA
jgi:stage V sporulation protein R